MSISYLKHHEVHFRFDLQRKPEIPFSSLCLYLGSLFMRCSAIKAAKAAHRER